MFIIESKMMMKVVSHPGHMEKHINWRGGGGRRAFKLCAGVALQS